MLTLTRSGLTLNLNASVVPATGSSNVPILYMEEVSDDYTGYLVEPRIGFTQNGKYTEFIGTYEEESQSVIIPAQCFANTGSVDITIALIDPEDPDHVEVCTPKKFSVTKAPMGTVVLPEEPTWQDYVLNYMKQNLDKLQGPQGDKGEPGDNATINVGAVTTLEPGQEATVTNTGSETNAVLAFGIPKGEKGDKGDKGDAGDNATIAIGTVTTLEPEQEATVQNTGTETNAVLSFGIPKGVQGDTGPQGPQGVPGVNENVLHADISKSENPSVDDAYEAPFQALKMYGKSTQVSTTGKNLFDISKVTTKENPNGTGIVNNGDGTLTVTNSAGNSGVVSDQKLSDVCPSLQIGETYILSGSSSATSNKNIYLSGVNIPWNFGSSKAIKQEMLDSYVTFYADSGGNTDTVSNLQIEKGTTATAYEPYTGRAPSPSPDYPQEITKIEEVDCNVVGKNLLAFPFPLLPTGESKTVDGITATANADGSVTVTGTKTIDEEKVLYIDLIIDKELASKGTITASPKGTDYYAFYDDANGHGGIAIKISTAVNFTMYPMLEVGSTVTAYEPYQSQHVQFTPPAPLYSLLDGSVADYVDVARGKYVYQLADVTFDGSADESWIKNSSTPAYGYQITINDIMPVSASTGNDIMSKQFRAVSSSTTSNIESGEFRRGGGGNENKNFIFKYDGLSTDDLDGWKAFLQSNNVFAVYPLATPTEQDIPAETLEALQALKTFNGVTNIFCNAPVSAQYEQSVQIVMNKILEQLNSLQTQTLSLQEEMINNV